MREFLEKWSGVAVVPGHMPSFDEDVRRRFAPEAAHHAPGCWTWGAGHYECALRHIADLNAMLEASRKR